MDCDLFVNGCTACQSLSACVHSRRYTTRNAHDRAQGHGKRGQDHLSIVYEWTERNLPSTIKVCFSFVAQEVYVARLAVLLCTVMCKDQPRSKVLRTVQAVRIVIHLLLFTTTVAALRHPEIFSHALIYFCAAWHFPCRRRRLCSVGASLRLCNKRTMFPVAAVVWGGHPVREQQGRHDSCVQGDDDESMIVDEMGGGGAIPRLSRKMKGKHRGRDAWTLRYCGLAPRIVGGGGEYTLGKSESTQHLLHTLKQLESHCRSGRTLHLYCHRHPHAL